MTFGDICRFLAKPVRTNETAAQYAGMTHDQRSRIKDISPFVCGRLRDGSRKADCVEYRSMLSLDGDRVTADFIRHYREKMPYASCLYSTHSSTPENPRCRLLVPLTRDVTGYEFEALSRLFAAELGMEMFDQFSHRINQPMFAGSVPRDMEYLFIVTEKDWLDPDAFLSRYPGWYMPSNLPHTQEEGKAKAKVTQDRKQENPLEKTGIVGAFCRTYSVSRAIEKYLPGVYRKCREEGRYDYIPGEGSAGVAVYDDLFAYSHHATDPAGGRLLNAFDLVRVHQCGAPDEKTSYLKMCALAKEDKAVQATLEKERLEKAQEDFEEDNAGWEEPLPLENMALPAFPVEALPAVLGDYARAVSLSTQTPVDMAAVSVLTVVSACMRNLYKVEGKADWLEPTNLYSVIIAEPSERKSAVISLAIKPVNSFVNEYNEQHKVEFEMSRAAKQRLENRRNSLLTQSRKKGESGSAEEFNDELHALVEEIVNFREEKPLKIYVDDTTPEKLTETLCENGNALSIISAEGGIFDILSGAYSSKVNIDVFLKAYSGERISVDRIMRHSVSVDEACLTILLSVQPVVIGELMANKKFRHRGLTARFLYAYPKSLVGRRNLHSAPVPENVYAAYKRLIYNLLSEMRTGDARIIKLTAGAQERIGTFYDWVERRLGGEYSMYGDWLGKLVGNTLRIAGILARASVMNPDGSGAILYGDDAVVIEASVMESAIKIARYFLVHAVNAYGEMGVRTDGKATLAAVDKIKEKALKTVTRRDIMRFCRWVGSAEEAQTLLDTLEDYGYVRLSSVDLSDKLRTGRPKNALYTVNPHVYQ